LKWQELQQAEQAVHFSLSRSFIVFFKIVPPNIKTNCFLS